MHSFMPITQERLYLCLSIHHVEHEGTPTIFSRLYFAVTKTAFLKINVYVACNLFIFPFSNYCAHVIHYLCI